MFSVHSAVHSFPAFHLSVCLAVAGASESSSSLARNPKTGRAKQPKHDRTGALGEEKKEKRGKKANFNEAEQEYTDSKIESRKILEQRRIRRK